MRAAVIDMFDWVWMLDWEAAQGRQLVLFGPLNLRLDPGCLKVAACPVLPSF